MTRTSPFWANVILSPSIRIFRVGRDLGHDLPLTEGVLNEDRASRLNEALSQKVKAYEKVVRDLERSQEQLQEKIADLEAFEQAVVGRELKMMELEKEIEKLKGEGR